MSVGGDIRLRIVAETKQYMAGLAEAGVATKRQAAAMGRDFARELVKGEGMAVRAAQQAAVEIAGAHTRSAAASEAAQERALADIQGQLRRTAMEAERVRIGDDAFRATQGLRDLDALEAKLRALGPMEAAATAQVAERRLQLNAALKAAKGPTEAAAASTMKLSGGLSAVAMQLPDVASQLASGTNPMMIFAMQGSQVAQSMMAGAGGVGVFAAQLATAAPFVAAAVLAAGVLGTGYLAVKNQAEAAAEANGRLAARVEETRSRTEAAAAAADKLGDAWKNAQRSIDDEVQSLIDINEGLDEYEVAANRKTRALQKDSEESIKAAGQRVAATKMEMAALDASIKSTRTDGVERDKAIARSRQLSSVLGAEEADLASKRRELDRGKQAIADNAEYTRELAAAEAAEAEAAKGAAGAEKARNAALERTNELFKSLLAYDEMRRSSLAELQAMTEISMASETPRYEAIIAARDAELVRIDELVAQTGALEAGEAARAASMQESEIALSELRAESIAKLEEQQAAYHKREMEQIAARRQAYLSAGDTIVGGLASITTAIDGAEGATDKQRMAAFRIAKGLAIAQAIINTAQGVTAALTLPVGGRIAAAVVAAAGAVQVAVIRRTEPKFHAGGMGEPALAPDEARTARVTRNEGVLTSRGVAAAGGADGLHALNRGEGSGGNNQVVGMVVTPETAGRIVISGLKHSKQAQGWVRATAMSAAMRVNWVRW